MIFSRFKLCIAFLFWSIISAATGMVQSLWQLLGLRLLLGAGESVVAPASLRWIRLHCEEKERGLAVGLYMTGTKIGPALAVPLTALLVSSYTWRAAFIILGVGGIVWLFFWLLIVRDDDHGGQVLSAGAARPAVSILGLMRRPLIWGILIGTFAYSYFLFFSLTWLPAYLVERRGLSLNSMGLYTGFSFGGMAVVATLAGWAADRLIARGRDPVQVRKAFTIAGLILASTELFGAYAESSSTALFFAIFSSPNCSSTF